MVFFENLIYFSQKVLSTLYDLGSRLITLLATPVVLNGTTYTIFEVLFGVGLVAFLTLYIVKALVGLA